MVILGGGRVWSARSAVAHRGISQNARRGADCGVVLAGHQRAFVHGVAADVRLTESLKSGRKS